MVRRNCLAINKLTLAGKLREEERGKTLWGHPVVHCGQRLYYSLFKFHCPRNEAYC
jgi:hypothetical protein